MNLYEKLLLQTAVVKQLKTITDETRAQVQDELEAGDMKRPRGLGSVSLSEPAVKAKVVDRADFENHCADQYGSECVTVAITGPTEEVLAVLADHAPHLIGEVAYVPEWMERQELTQAEAGHVIPGVELVESAPRLMVRPKPAAEAEAAQILAGTPLAIEGGDQ